MKVDPRYIKASHELYRKWYSLRNTHRRTKNLMCDDWAEDRLLFFQWAFDNEWYPGVRFYRKDKRKPYSPHNTALIGPFDNVKSKTTHQKAILTEDQVREIKKLLRDNYSQVMIAKKFNVCSSTISCVKTGKTWSHIQ